MRNRSIRKNKFNLPSMRALWKELGGCDALVEYIECARLQFDAKQKGSELPFGVFLSQQANEVGVNVRSIDIDRLSDDIIRWYLIFPYGCFDHFSKDFKKEVSGLGITITYTGEDGKNTLQKMLDGLKDANVSISVPQWKIDLDNYYRHCRNSIAHSGSPIDKGEFKKLAIQSIQQEYPTLPKALSSSDKLFFDDYTLCTANLKNISDTITTDIFNSIRWDKVNFVDIFNAQKIKQYDQERRQSWVIHAIKSKYGIEISKDDAKLILDKIPDL